MWIKVCGVTTREAAEVAADAGADAIGLMLIDSPRRISPEEAASIGAGLDVERIALIDGEEPDQALETLSRIGATGVQPYGSRASTIAGRAAAAGYLVLRPVRVSDHVDLSAVALDQLPLLDVHHPQLRGGTGTTFDWSLAIGLDRPTVIAGGLGPDNVASLVARAHPWGVDASSRLESSPGRKDLDLVRAFVTNAKQAVPEQ